MSPFPLFSSFVFTAVQFPEKRYETKQVPAAY